MNSGRDIIFDPHKETANLEKHGVSLSLLDAVLANQVSVAVDARRDYGETRFVSFGYVGNRLHVAVWTPRGDRVRAISLRRANSREQQRYGEYPPTSR